MNSSAPLSEMEPNKTSESVVHFQTYEEPFFMSPAEFDAIARKYHEMEAAIRDCVEVCGHDKYTDLCDCYYARKALSFDPLND